MGCVKNKLRRNVQSEWSKPHANSGGGGILLISAPRSHMSEARRISEYEMSS